MEYKDKENILMMPQKHWSMALCMVILKQANWTTGEIIMKHTEVKDMEFTQLATVMRKFSDSDCTFPSGVILPI
jgi:hypothetical protein